MKSFKLAQSRNGLPIIGHVFNNGGPKVLILGGVHGDEVEGVVATKGLLAEFMKSFTYKLQVTVITEFNIDGVLNKQRVNAAGIDLNRNLPTKDWSVKAAQKKYNPGPFPCSEPENKGLVKWIEENQPQFIFSIHSWKPMLNINGLCSPEVDVISRLTGYKIKPSVGYPTPGSLGTYTGFERKIPTITYEIERGLSQKSVLKHHVPAILEALKCSTARN